MTEESENCSDEMKKLFDKKLVMTKMDEEDFKKSATCWISVMFTFMAMLK